MFHSVTLEMSLKPFRRTDDETVRTVCAQMFQQWYPLIKNRRQISVLLWTGDGSEILDYSGEPDARFEWSCYIGTANNALRQDEDHPDRSLHERKRYYIKNPPVMTYRILRRIVCALKIEGKRVCPGAEIRVGATFDIGPEFALSDFKYNRHPEICTGTKLDELGFVDSTALLHGDDRRYASCPDGIPDGTPFGTFLGMQSNVFLKDMGFDYIWLSNGLGFSADPWDAEGKIFDGKRFYPERLSETKEKVFRFWKQFRAACPDFPIETRGTNNSVGIDYASDGVPLYDIYRSELGITPPPNSPWAALNDDFGLELMGHMTRICELPGDSFMMRYYVHDPWWVNSPWYDRYNGCPHDIYLPLAVARLDEKGEIQNAGMLNILTVDNSFGNMPDACVYEPLPHLLKAEKEAPDRPAPFVWVYPMREYTTSSTEEMLRGMYYGDRFIRDAINDGFPLNCVVSSDNFLKHPLDLYRSSILISPTQPNGAVAARLEEFTARGGRVIYYSANDTDGAVSIYGPPQALRDAARNFGYDIIFDRKTEGAKSPVLTLHRHNNALIFSVYNPNTTTDTRLRFPLGAPVLDCGETELVDGYASYRFSRCERRECRVFVQQQAGVVSVKEVAPVSGMYRRKLLISGLREATVCVFPEYSGAERCIFVKADSFYFYDKTPVADDRWHLVEDAQGIYYKAEHITGDYCLYMPFPENH